MDNFVLGNMALNAGLVAVVWYFVRNWMKTTKSETEANARALAEITAQHSKETSILVDKNQQEVKNVARELAEITAQAAAGIKLDLREHRDLDIKATDEIKHSLDKVFDQLREANGKTAQNVLNIALQAQRCDDRTKGKRKEDCRE